MNIKLQKIKIIESKTRRSLTNKLKQNNFSKNLYRKLWMSNEFSDSEIVASISI